MILEMFTIYDVKARVYQTPKFALNEAMAKRNFEIHLTEENTIFTKFPDDFQIFHIGSYDDDTGEIKQKKKPTYLYSVRDLITWRLNAESSMLHEDAKNNDKTEQDKNEPHKPGAKKSTKDKSHDGYNQIDPHIISKEK